jgi:hypothetical protein
MKQARGASCACYGRGKPTTVPLVRNTAVLPGHGLIKRDGQDQRRPSCHGPEAVLRRPLVQLRWRSFARRHFFFSASVIRGIEESQQNLYVWQDSKVRTASHSLSSAGDFWTRMPRHRPKTGIRGLPYLDTSSALTPTRRASEGCCKCLQRNGRTLAGASGWCTGGFRRNRCDQGGSPQCPKGPWAGAAWCA